MTNTQGFLKNAITRHAIFIQRFAGGETKEIAKFLERARKETVSKMNKIIVSQNADNPWTQLRLERLLNEIDELLKATYTQMGLTVGERMVEFADYEAGFTKRMVEKGTKNIEMAVPTQNQLKAAIFAELMDVQPGGKGITIRQALARFNSKKRKEILNIIRQGNAQGNTVKEMTSEVNRIMKGKHTRQAEALVRTITNHVGNIAREETYRANRDVIEEEEWVSTLDGRTSHICRSLDGKRFKVGRGIHPPAHFNCRSQRVPVIKEEFRILTDFPSKRSARDPKTGKSKLVHGKTTYNSWLKDQPKGFQEEVLGKTRAKLFREGGLSMDKFVDHNYKEIPLNKLKRLEPKAFEAAGLN